MFDNLSSSHRLAMTARWTAGARARESQRPDRLFDDPWAERLAGPEGKAWAEQQSADTSISTIVRTRFFDEFLLRAIAASSLRQVVLLAAGLDTRAYRLPWPDHTHLFEVDQPQVLEYKEQILAETGAHPGCSRKTIAGDLTASWKDALLQAGFQPQRPSAWLLEGLLPYLPNEASAHLLDEMTSLSAPGSWLGFDAVNGVVLTFPWMQPLVTSLARHGTPWIGTMDDPVADLAVRGWQATVTQPGEADAHYGRWPYPPLSHMMPAMPAMSTMPRHWLVTAYKS
jgi:methyltransferase (TIGR00027 family)